MIFSVVNNIALCKLVFKNRVLLRRTAEARLCPPSLSSTRIRHFGRGHVFSGRRNGGSSLCIAKNSRSATKAIQRFNNSSSSSGGADLCASRRCLSMDECVNGLAPAYDYFEHRSSPICKEISQDGASFPRERRMELLSH